MLIIKDLIAGYRKGYSIIDGVNLTLKPGERIGITGRNGIGKSTLVKAIMKLTPYYSGLVSFENKTLHYIPTHDYASHGISYFIQDGAIFPNLTVKENLGISIMGKKDKSVQSVVKSFSPFFTMFDRPGFLNQQSVDLSGGERIMLALTMVMANNPRLLILDEPAAGISPANIKVITDFLISYSALNTCTMLLIDQNIKMLETICNDIYLLKNKRLCHFHD